MIGCVLAACGGDGGSSLNGLTNVAPDGSYGFNGAGWKLSSTEWVNAGPPTRYIHAPIPACLSGSAEACEQLELARHNSNLSSMAKDLGQLGSKHAYWYSFLGTDGSTVYEVFFETGGGLMNVEMFGVGLTDVEAEDTLLTFQFK
jgi:hypothetical protein